MIVGIGIDIVEIRRIGAMRERHGDRFYTKILLPDEIEYCLARKNSDQHFAARFAAKEAGMKALGTGWSMGVGFKSIEVVRAQDSPPRLVFHGKAVELAERLGVVRTHLSLTHSEQYAVAQVVLEAAG